MRYRRAKAGCLLGALLLSTACASVGGVRHVATVTVVSAHNTLSAIQDTEQLLVCGRSTAPAAPACVPIPINQKISGELSAAFDLDGRLATLVRDTPVGAPQPDAIPTLVGDIAQIVAKVLNDLPSSPQKTTLVQRLGGK